jgi:hypothetical protein
VALAGVQVEGGDALHPVDERVEVRLVDVEQVHRQAARLDVDLAQLLGLAQDLRPADLAGAPQLVHVHATLGARLGGEAVIAIDPLVAERVQGPVLEEDVHRPPEGGGAGGQHRGGLELVVRAGEQHEVERFGHGWTPWFATGADAVARPASRSILRRSTPRMSSQARSTSGSARR